MVVVRIARSGNPYKIGAGLLCTYKIGAGLLCKNLKHVSTIVNSNSYREGQSSPAPR
jgi:hypothetical protein